MSNTGKIALSELLSIDDINIIIYTVKEGKRLEGKDYTNGNIKRSV